MKKIILTLLSLSSLVPSLQAVEKTSAQDAPRVVNIINFVRLTEPRTVEIPQIAWMTDSVLLASVESQMQCMKRYGLKGTFLLQYDALCNEGHQRLIEDKMPEGCEVGAWWEITQPHVEDAGLTWRGRYPWDWYANVGFSVAYTPEERLKLVDVYMEKFKEIFGSYPKSVGSWFIDSYSLNYMREKYGIVASTACRDQLGTDGYNLWGGYWAGAYYPSKNNMFIPAQTADEQIDVPVFRMLGSDPIWQYDQGLGGRHQGVVTLEPVYGNCGGDPRWINWYFNTMINDPAMGMTYFQSGQENSFTWRRMRYGLEYQWPMLAYLAAAGDIELETLAESGTKFSACHASTPPTALTTMSDVNGTNRRTLWFNGKNYRLNLLWDGDAMFVRDIHLFDQDQKSLYLDSVCTTTYCEYFTLPVVDGNVWSNDSVRGCMRFYALEGPAGERRELRFGAPESSHDEANTTFTTVVPIIGEPYAMVVTLNEDAATFAIQALNGASPLRWQMALEYAPEATLPFTELKADGAKAAFRSWPYGFTVTGASLRNAANLPMTTRGALTAFVIEPEYSTLTLNLKK